MQYEATIREKVTEFVQTNKLFTSVDIANAIKSTGLWVRNVAVRDWLQENFNDKDVFEDYVISQISVCNGNAMASLYHPGLNAPSEYTDRDQRSLTPDEVKAIQKANVGKVKDTAADIDKILKANSDDEEDDTDDSVQMTVVLRSLQRLKIPTAMIKALGWVPGQTIDPALILTTNVIPGTLKVNDDFRVSIPRTAVPWGTKPVKVILKDGKISFKKA